MKRFTTIVAALAASSMVAAPALAAPTNAASSLSVAKARASALTAKGEKLGEGGGAIFGIAIAAGVAAIAIIAAVQNDDSDSN